jgi:hypothetical protein
MMPVPPAVPFEAGRVRLRAPVEPHRPAAVPAGFTEHGVPLSVQLVEPPNDEDTLFALAAQLEAARGPGRTAGRRFRANDVSTRLIGLRWRLRARSNVTVPCIVEVALNGATTKETNPRVPRSPSAITADARCVHRGRRRDRAQRQRRVPLG